jgi:hypothetical protein
MSSIPACKAAILQLLAANTDLAGVDLRWAPPTEGEDIPPGGEAVYLMDTEIVDDNWATLGRNQGQGTRREEYRVGIGAWVAQYGDDPQATETRMWALWTEILSTIATDIFAAPSVLRLAGVETVGQVTALQSTGPFDPERWAARVDGRVTFRARIT